MTGDLTAQLSIRLADVSDQIKREVGALIPGAAERMIGILHSRYPVGRTSHPDVPHMRQDIYSRTGQSQDALIPARKVIGPRLAYIWQDGTRDRVDATRGNARRGRMPAADPDFFQRTAAQVRGDMLQKALAILNRSREIA